jgi:Tol biopolymer transport system component
MIGTKLAHYEFVGHLGSGGMGTVWRARDTKLDREVAIKALPTDAARDAESLARLQREAKLLATLKHPGIAAIYGIEEQQGTQFLVLELVEGETLAERLRRGPIPLEDALRLVRQIADALEAAHEKGVIHRDLKPANIKITPDETAKVLDFGLAKSIPRIETDEAVTSSVEPTQAGMILGTVAYMSPEQARGKALDKRTDIWAFGVVLYEMLTGERPFHGSDSSETLINILTQKPDLERIPSRARRLIATCLEKDPKHRLRDLGDAWALLDETEVKSKQPSNTRLTWLLGVAALVLLVALSVVSFFYLRPVETQPVLRYNIALPEGAASVHSFAISPNGRTLAIAAMVNGKRQLWLRPMDALQATPLPFTEDATYPFWSPDNSSIGFFAQGYLKKVAAAGGPADSICAVPDARGGSWNRDGVIVFASAFGGRVSLQRIQSSGGTPANISDTQGDYTNPAFLPDGQHFLLVSRRGEKSGIYVSSLDGKEMHRILPDVSSVVYAAPSRQSADRAGRLLFVRDNALMAQQFDAGSTKLLAEASLVVKGVSLTTNTIYAPVTVSETGVLLYVNEGSESVSHMYWFDRNGQIQQQMGSGDEYQPALSRDGKMLLFSRGRPSVMWLRDLNRGTEQILSTGSDPHGAGAWSPEGDRIVYGVQQNGTWNIYQKRPTLSSQDELLVTSPYSKAPMQWSNGFLVYQEFNSETKRDIWFLRMDAATTGKPQPFLQTSSDELFPELSPDGRWMAYTSDISGRREVWVRAFPAADREVQISTDGGQQPRWRRDSKELFFDAGDGKLTAVAVNTQGDLFTPGPLRPLFDMHLAQTENGAQFQYDVSPDGNRFLIISHGTANAPPVLNVIVNWPGESSGR